MYIVSSGTTIKETTQKYSEKNNLRNLNTALEKIHLTQKKAVKEQKEQHTYRKRKVK